MPHFCDVIGCKNERRRHQRLCARCYAALPDWLRLGIIEAKRLRRGRGRCAIAHWPIIGGEVIR